MATYNGMRYIKPQVESILAQLADDDELVVVDDGSSDGTPDWVEGLGDSRIRVHRNEQNLGPVRTFERALGLARGVLVFFADQDDVWMPDKVEAFREVLKRERVAALVSDATVVDGDGNELLPSFFAHRRSGPGLVRNFVRNSYLGCCMVVRAEMKPMLLPFPPGVVQHDEWIGLACEVVGGVRFVPRPLIQYRRHGANASAFSRLPLRIVARNRTRMLIALLGRLPRLLSARRAWRTT